MSTLQQRLESVRARIEGACQRSGRAVDDVTLIAVTKGQPAEVLWEARRMGLNVFGENYVQEALGKIHSWPQELSSPQWHFIGHLQSNKVRHILPHVSLIHSVDRLSLALEIERCATRLGRSVDVLLEVNVAAQATKHGVAPDEAEGLLESILEQCPHVQVRGLMVFPPFVTDAQESRAHFAHARTLAHSLQKHCRAGSSMRHLSMGVSSDFEVAIEEGSTLIRLGTVLLGERS